MGRATPKRYERGAEPTLTLPPSQHSTSASAGLRRPCCIGRDARARSAPPGAGLGMPSAELGRAGEIVRGGEQREVLRDALRAANTSSATAVPSLHQVSNL